MYHYDFKANLAPWRRELSTKGTASGLAKEERAVPEGKQAEETAQQGAAALPEEPAQPEHPVQGQLPAQGQPAQAPRLRKIPKYARWYGPD